MQSIWFLLMGDLMSYKKLSASNNKMRTLNFEDERLMIWTWNHQARTLVHATHNLVNILFFFSLFFFFLLNASLTWAHWATTRDTFSLSSSHFLFFWLSHYKNGYFSEVTFEQKTKERERKKNKVKYEHIWNQSFWCSLSWTHRRWLIPHDSGSAWWMLHNLSICIETVNSNWLSRWNVQVKWTCLFCTSWDYISHILLRL